MTVAVLAGAAVVRGVIGVGLTGNDAERPAPATYSICHTGGGTSCTVDGNTAWIDGVKARSPT